MGRLAFDPVQELSRSQIETVGDDLHFGVIQPDVRNLMYELNIPSVLGRHAKSQERSKRSVLNTRNQSRQLGYQAFVIRNASSPRYNAIGMASIIDNLPVHVPRSQMADDLISKLELSARFVRNFPIRKFPPLLSTTIETPGANVAAWTVDMAAGPEAKMERVAETYTFLREQYPHSWTLTRESPVVVPHPHITGLEEAGFVAFSNEERRYDDGEWQDKPTPHTLMYVAGVEVA